MTDVTRERYINPYTDFGFKRLFGTEMNKELLISFLNALFSGHEEITDITYKNSEQLGAGITDRKAVFDVYCKNKQGKYFIVEMQKAEQDYFNDRSVFYSTFPIREQAQQGKWVYQLKAVYTVEILNFVFPDDEYPEECLHHEIKLMDTADKHGDPPTSLSSSQAPFYDKLTFVYLEMPKFKKREEELVTLFDKWLVALSNLSRLMERPKALQERIFTRLFEQTEIAKLNPTELHDYEESVKVYRDLFNVVSTAERKGRVAGHAEGLAKGRAEGLAKGRAEGLAEGRAEGLAEGRAEGLAEGRAEGILEAQRENAQRMIGDGLPISLVAKYTGLSEEDLKSLLQ